MRRSARRSPSTVAPSCRSRPWEPRRERQGSDPWFWSHAPEGAYRLVRSARPMRVALVSDMHGNAVALRAALADVERHDVDLIVSLGDVAQGGPQPLECVELLRELGCPCILGNADDFLLTLKAGRLVEDEEREAEMRE